MNRQDRQRLADTVEDWLGRLLRPLDLPYRPRYYLRRPWRAITYQRRRARWAWQRIRRGYSDMDWWNLDNYLDMILAGALVKLADGIAHPATLTPDEWDAGLRKAAAAFQVRVDRELAGEELSDEECRAHEAARQWVVDHWGHLWD